MALADEIERLAKLREQGTLTAEEFARAKNMLLSGLGPSTLPVQCLRRESARRFCGLPLWSIALGPDYARGEWRGHARGIIAVGDIATGCLALGGFARGIIAVGGAAVGLVALGGGAVGGIAIGGGALGGIALGGGACGYYALGGGALGVHTLSAMHRDPAAVDFFQRFLPFLKQVFRG